MNSGSIITVNKRGGPAPRRRSSRRTILEDVGAPPPRGRAARRRPVWQYECPDCEPQLDFLNTVVKTVDGTQKYVRGRLAYAEQGCTDARRSARSRVVPIVNLEYCRGRSARRATSRSWNWGWYATGHAASTRRFRSDSSIHLVAPSTSNETAFPPSYVRARRTAVARADPLTPYKGREHALSWAILLQDPVIIVAPPGYPGRVRDPFSRILAMKFHLVEKRARVVARYSSPAADAAGSPRAGTSRLKNGEAMLHRVPHGSGQRGDRRAHQPLAGNSLLAGTGLKGPRWRPSQNLGRIRMKKWRAIRLAAGRRTPRNFTTSGPP